MSFTLSSRLPLPSTRGITVLSWGLPPSIPLMPLMAPGATLAAIPTGVYFAIAPIPPSGLAPAAAAAAAPPTLAPAMAAAAAAASAPDGMPGIPPGIPGMTPAMPGIPAPWTHGLVVAALLVSAAFLAIPLAALTMAAPAVAPYPAPQGFSPPAPSALATPPACLPSRDCTPAPAAVVAAESATFLAILASLLGGFLVLAVSGAAWAELVARGVAESPSVRINASEVRRMGDLLSPKAGVTGAGNRRQPSPELSARIHLPISAESAGLTRCPS